MTETETGAEAGQNRAKAGFADTARQRAIEVYEDARDSVAGVGRQASEALDEAPLIAIAGGIAAGALIAALLPRTDTETKLLRPVGERLRGSAQAAAEAARQAGTERLSELGLTRDKGAETVRSLLQGAGDAARASARAALDAAKNPE